MRKIRSTLEVFHTSHSIRYSIACNFYESIPIISIFVRRLWSVLTTTEVQQLRDNGEAKNLYHASPNKVIFDKSSRSGSEATPKQLQIPISLTERRHLDPPCPPDPSNIPLIVYTYKIYIQNTESILIRSTKNQSTSIFFNLYKGFRL
jgi:hypothetical protein